MPGEKTEDRRRQLEALMEEYGSSLLRMCCLYLKDADLAQDALQDTFLKAYRGLDRFRGECSEKTWLTGIAINCCRDYLRTAWFRKMDRRTDVSALPETADSFEFPDSTVLIEVRRLPARYREVVLLRYYQGLKLKETADALHLSDSTVKQRLKKANGILHSRLKEWYFDEE